jgi:hypothetical protein
MSVRQCGHGNSNALAGSAFASVSARLQLWVVSNPALLRSTCLGIAAGNRNKERAGFSGIREARTDADAATEERMIQLQLQPEIEAELAA